MMHTLSKIAGLFHLSYIDKEMILAQNHSGKRFLEGHGLKVSNHLGCLNQSWIPLDYFFTRFGSPERFDNFWDEFCTIYKNWEKRHHEVFCLALLGTLVFPLDKRCVNTHLQSVEMALIKKG